MDVLKFSAGNITLSHIKKLLTTHSKIDLDIRCQPSVQAARDVVDELLAQGKIMYGINTGFGKLANKIIPTEQLIDLQHNLLRSHAVGTGPVLRVEIAQLITILKLNCMAQGFSGVRWDLIDYFSKLYNSDIYPIIPAKGSVGASGDLAPLAHLSLLLIGEGEAQYQQARITGIQALEILGLQPLKLQPKEGLALINGTQVSTAILCFALFQAQIVFDAALCASALSSIAVNANLSPIDARIQILRRLPSQMHVAEILRFLTEDSLQRTVKKRVQDPYSIRCVPQVMGACLGVMQQIAQILECEINAVTDNPLIFSKEKEILSGGNFHAEPIAFAADQLACVLAEIANLSERRINLLCDESLSGLPSFLIKENGLNSGFMMPHVTAAALSSENKMYAHPIGVDSIPTSGNQEDHVSMATSAAFRLLEMIENTTDIISIEMLAACQGIDLREATVQNSALHEIYTRIRQHIPFLDKDRYLSPEISQVKNMILAQKFELPCFLDSKVNVFSERVI
ncbi:histidine ammonia-lyase [Candidatus Berkiella cookevillensis]|uniref:Histidine ammonia-lyase n=1 Tax=Candidatus Berkiella cookevillensis TaxID=437022 RepID=A0A0Q9YS48_9GAMM|nr:histidine ammonia-lyase [Candidatus Berkiella cookevillensis]MCS5708943.1 histidine ammonia-lyase [Candidatus Berkiella cookevillensis]